MEEQLVTISGDLEAQGAVVSTSCLKHTMAIGNDDDIKD